MRVNTNLYTTGHFQKLQYITEKHRLKILETRLKIYS